jgi:hypothetical protein
MLASILRTQKQFLSSYYCPPLAAPHTKMKLSLFLLPTLAVAFDNAFQHGLRLGDGHKRQLYYYDCYEEYIDLYDCKGNNQGSCTRDDDIGDICMYDCKYIPRYQSTSTVAVLSLAELSGNLLVTGFDSYGRDVGDGEYK